MEMDHTFYWHSLRGPTLAIASQPTSSVGDPWYFCADPDPGTDQDPNPTPNPTLFFSDFKDAKKNIFFSHIFLLLIHKHIIFSLKTLILLKFCVKILFCKHYLIKGKDPNPEGPKTNGSCGPGSPTLPTSTFYLLYVINKYRTVLASKYLKLKYRTLPSEAPSQL